MQETKDDQANYWRNHINQALANKQSPYEYCTINKISKSAMYRWKKYFSELNAHQPTQKIAKRKYKSPFSPVVVTEAQLQNQSYQQNSNLPDSKWVAEIIVKVIQGLS